MKLANWARRHMGLGMLIGMAGFAVLGYHAIRRDVESLRVISQDNILWTASQMEVELLRFQLSVADAAILRTTTAVEIMRERFDILWSRIFMIGSGRVGGQIARYDNGYDAVGSLKRRLEELDPVVTTISPDDEAGMQALLAALAEHQHDLRLFTLRVVRGDTAAAAELRARIQVGAQATAAISVAAVLLSLLALTLILRDNRRQRDMAEYDRRLAQDAEISNRAKSRFLGMMSHELRNPLNGVLGPLALLGQSDLAPRHLRLVERAQHSGRSMLQLVTSLLDYGEIQDGRLQMRAEPFRLKALVDDVRAELAAAGRGDAVVRALPADVNFANGDPVRLRHVFVNLAAYVMETADSPELELVFSHDGAALTGELRFAPGDAALDWRSEIVTGLGVVDPNQVSAEALRPQIARGLIAAAHGVLDLAELADGRRAIRVSIPAPRVGRERIRVVLDTRSEAMAAIYRAALRSDRVVFVDPRDCGPVDIVLVDASSLTEEAGMARLRSRFPSALFVSLGATERPETFDEVVEGPADMSRLRSRLLGEPA